MEEKWRIKNSPTPRQIKKFMSNVFYMKDLDNATFMFGI